MTTAIIGTGGIGSVIARQLASGGETLRPRTLGAPAACRRDSTGVGTAAAAAGELVAGMAPETINRRCLDRTLDSRNGGCPLAHRLLRQQI